MNLGKQDLKGKKTPLTLAFTAFSIYSMPWLPIFLNKSIRPYVLFCNLCFNRILPDVRWLDNSLSYICHNLLILGFWVEY